MDINKENPSEYYYPGSEISRVDKNVCETPNIYYSQAAFTATMKNKETRQNFAF